MIIISPPTAGWEIKTADFITDERAMYRYIGALRSTKDAAGFRLSE